MITGTYNIRQSQHDSLFPNSIEADLRQSVQRLYTQLFEVGIFDPNFIQPYTQIPPSVVDSQNHSDLALQAARESIVLLKNEGNILPLSKSLRIAVIGPNADIRETLLSNYHGQRCKDGSYDCVMSPLEGIRTKVPYSSVTYARGIFYPPCLIHLQILRKFIHQ